MKLITIDTIESDSIRSKTMSVCRAGIAGGVGQIDPVPIGDERMGWAMTSGRLAHITHHNGHLHG